MTLAEVKSEEKDAVCGKGGESCVVGLNAHEKKAELIAEIKKKYPGRRWNEAMNGIGNMICKEGEDATKFDCGLGTKEPGGAAGGSAPPGQSSPSKKNAGRDSSETGSQNGNGDGKGNGGEDKENDPSKAESLPVSQLAQQTPQNQCDYGGGTPLTQEFYKLRRDCDRTHSEAGRLCDFGANKEIQSAMANARSLSQKVAASASSKQSLLQACNNFTRASDRLKDALNSYQKRCTPVKDKCENSCVSAAKTAKSISETFDKNPACYQSIGPMVDDLGKHSKSANTKFKACYAHRDPLKRAQNDANELMASMERSNLCENRSAEACRLDPNTGACIIGAGQGSRFLTSSKSLKSGNGSGVEGEGGGGFNQKGIPDITPVESRTLGSSAYGVQGGGNSNENSDFDPLETEAVNGATGAIGRKPGDKKGFKGGRNSGGGYYSGGGRRRGGKRWTYKYDGPKFHKKKKGKKKGQLAKGKGLKKFLPGGKNDPNRKDSVDGITSALGPDLFEKVSRRYKLHEPRMFQERATKKK